MKEYRRYAEKLGMHPTPLVNVSKVFSANPNVRIFAKDESKNLTGSLKIRAALYNVVQAMLENPGKQLHFIDASSGNYALALAYIVYQLRFKATIFVPEKFLLRFNKFIKNYGLKNIDVIAKGIKDSDEARVGAAKYSLKHKEMIYLNQYSNDGTWLCHYETTACEILEHLEKIHVSLTHFICGIGSGGALIGIGRKMKEEKMLTVIGIESTKAHHITGLRHLETETLPQIYFENQQVVNRLVSVKPEEVVLFKSQFPLLKFGISAFANLYAAQKLSKELKEGLIITIIPDGGYNEENR